MEFKLKNIYEDKPDKTVNLPDKLPASVGEKAEQKLKGKLKGSKRGRNGKNVNANFEVGTTDYMATKNYIAKQMIKKYADVDVNFDEIASESVNKIARFYWEDIQFFSQKKGQSSKGKSNT